MDWGMRFFDRRQGPAPSSLLWSKGYPGLCDFGGPESYWHAGTEICQPVAFFREHFREAHGLVWVRLSTQSRVGKPSDLDHFVEGALPTIRRPFALLTTDGDVSVPSDLVKATVEAILASPWLVAWHTQNHDGHPDPRFRPLPIGLDFHSERRPPIGAAALASLLSRLRDRRRPLDRQRLRVFTDFNKRKHAPARLEAVATLRGSPHVDFLRKHVSQAAIWEKYASYPFVLSAIGNGLDCHRTWELLYLGCIVITRTSSLDPLFAGLPVVIVKEWEEVKDPANLRKWLEAYGSLTERGPLWRRLDPANWLAPIREEVRRAAAQVPVA